MKILKGITETVLNSVSAQTIENKTSSEAAIEDGTEEKKPPSIQGKDGVYSSTEYINGNDKKCSNDKINTPV